MTTTPAQKPMADQIQDILLRYRSTKTNDEADRNALAQMIGESSLPSFWKEAMMAIFFPKSPEELTISMTMVQIQEQQRHASMMASTFSRLLQARLQHPT